MHYEQDDDFRERNASRKHHDVEIKHFYLSPHQYSSVNMGIEYLRWKLQPVDRKREYDIVRNSDAMLSEVKGKREISFSIVHILRPGHSISISHICIPIAFSMPITLYFVCGTNIIGQKSYV